MKIIVRIIKKIVKIIAIVITIVLLIPLTASIYIFSGISACSKISYTPATTIVTQSTHLDKQAKEIKSSMNNYHRSEESTFLTFPEWYIVYSSQEYAKTLENKLPSEFPYFSAIKQFWNSYCYVNALTHKKYPFNADDHIMIMVIGSSLTLEYIVKGIYENTIGRFSEWTSHHQQVEEDKYAYKVANDYAMLIPIRPWYEFTFLNSLKGLWHQTSWWGENNFRKWERKIILSAEYSFKAFYAWAIEKSSHAAFGVADITTSVWLTHVNQKSLEKYANAQNIHSLADGSFIVSLPRYQPFTDDTLELMHEAFIFNDIADNHIIMLSAVLPDDAKFDEGTIVFSLPVLISKNDKRIAIVTPVSKLTDVIKALNKLNAKIEHIYDY